MAHAGILTDVEFVELRYSGTPAAFLRGFRALYLGLFINTVVIGWVNLAMASVLVGMFDIPPGQVMLFVAFPSVSRPFTRPSPGSGALPSPTPSSLSWPWPGRSSWPSWSWICPDRGMAGLLEKVPPSSALLHSHDIRRQHRSDGGNAHPERSSFFRLHRHPVVGLLVPRVGTQRAHVAQRMMSAKDERHSLFATLWFTVAHYCLRPWPWIIVGLATLVLYPDLGAAEKRLGYVYAMRDFLPAGIKGMLVAAFFAAYISTIATQLNWGTSYIVNDFYRRFVRPDAGEKHLVAVSRIGTLAIMAFSAISTSIMETISGAWAFIIEAGAELGLVLILHWLSSPINAWSEIAAMVTPLAVYGWLHFATDIRFPETLYTIVAAPPSPGS